jgi:predicted permease
MKAAHILQDVRYGWRWMRRSPMFTTVATLTLAIGIGANTAIFSLVDAVILRALPVQRPAELVAIDAISPRGTRRNLSYRLFSRMRESNDVFAGVLAASDGPNRMELTIGSGGPEPVQVQLVSGEYFDLLGVHALVGRSLSTDDDRPQAAAVAVISHAYWTRRFARDASAVGRVLTIRKQAVTIVGVAPAVFSGEAVGRAPDLWVPLVSQPRFDRGMSLLDDPNVGWLRVMARVRPARDSRQVEASLAVLLARLKTEPAFRLVAAQIQVFRAEDGSRGLSDFRERFAVPLAILSGVVAIALLIACANVSNLLLARAAGRQREVAVRLALGARRGRLIAQCLTESLLLATIGGALGLLIAQYGGQALLALASTDDGPIPIALEANARVLAFTTAIGVATVIAFGLAPALIGSRVEIAPTLKHAGGGRARGGFGGVLIVSQIALSLLLLTGAALFVQTLRNLRTQDFGFAPESLVQIRIAPEANGYRPEQLPDLANRILDRIAAVPGVSSATAAHAGFSGASSTCCIAIEGRTEVPGEDRQVRTLGVSPGYFRTLDLPLVAGRDFEDRERSNSRVRPPTVAIVNEAFARRYYGTVNPVGRRFGWGDPPRAKYDTEIVGVAKDAIYADPRQEVKPLIYSPYSFGSWFLVRTGRRSDAVMATLHREIRGVDDSLGVLVTTVSSEVERTLVRERLLATLSSAFAILAALLAAIGLYGVMAYAVARRTREIGIRMALGASARGVLRQELSGALRLAAVGILLGLPAAIAIGPLVQAQLFRIAATDVLTLGTTAAWLALVAAAAGFLPARRASRVDPIVALRAE